MIQSESLYLSLDDHEDRRPPLLQSSTLSFSCEFHFIHFAMQPFKAEAQLIPLEKLQPLRGISLRNLLLQAFLKNLNEDQEEEEAAVSL